MSPRFGSAISYWMNPAFSRLPLLLVLSLLTIGCAAEQKIPVGEETLRPVDPRPFLDRPAHLATVHLPSPVFSGTLAAVVVNFDGQNLRATSNNMDLKPPMPGRLREVYDAALYPYLLRLFEVRGRSGKTLGYLVTHSERLVNSYLDGGDTLVLEGKAPRGGM